MDRPPATYEEETCEDLLEHAQQNAQALLIATIAFLRDRAIPPAEWADALGRSFGRLWSDVEDWEAGEFLEAILTGYRALGAEIVTADLDAGRATATLSGFPEDDLCVAFSVDPELVDAFHDLPAGMAASLGLSWRWSRHDDDINLTVSAARGS